MIDAVRAAVEREVAPLDDIKARAVWRRVEREICDETVAAGRGRGHRGAAAARLRVGLAFAAAFAVAAAIVSMRGGDGGVALRAERPLGPVATELAGVRAWTIGDARASLRVYAGRLALLVIDHGIIAGTRGADSAELRLLSADGVADLEGAEFRIEVSDREVVIASSAALHGPAQRELELRADSARAGPTSEDRSPTSEDRSPISDHRSPTSDDRSPITDHRSPKTDHRSPTSEDRSPKTDHREPHLPRTHELYSQAENALRAGELDRADYLLASVVVAEPKSELAAQARFDRALIALRRGDGATAVRRLRLAIDSSASGDLRAAARRLLCTVDDSAPECDTPPLR